MDYKETIKERIKILPDELKSFVLEEKWREDAEKIGGEFNLDEEKYAALENEIFLVLLCLEPRKDFVENIKKELGMDANDTTWIAEDVEKNIFSKVSDELNAIENQIEENEKENVGEKETEPQSSGVGGSFEQIILNQARAMQPAIPPENLPTGEQKQNEPPQTAVPDYRGSDPYREPVE